MPRYYIPGSTEPFKISRSKIELFMQCPRCFYLDRRLGVSRPPGFPFTLNSAVDRLLKTEFDDYRKREAQHPILEDYKVDARPVKHQQLDSWRNNFKGVQFFDATTNMLIFGAIDDLWINSAGEYLVVDYKATSKDEDIIDLNKDWQDGYKRQMEIYQWLLRKNDLPVSNIGYFLYCNGKSDKDYFNKKLEFDVNLIAYRGNDSWINDVLINIHSCLNSSNIPNPSNSCDYCKYISEVNNVNP